MTYREVDRLLLWLVGGLMFLLACGAAGATGGRLAVKPVEKRIMAKQEEVLARIEEIRREVAAKKLPEEAKSKLLKELPESGKELGDGMPRTD